MIAKIIFHFLLPKDSVSGATLKTKRRPMPKKHRSPVNLEKSVKGLLLGFLENKSPDHVNDNIVVFGRCELDDLLQPVKRC